MLIELHILQNFAPSNLNRDDTNNPKDCEFGGARRARISSQCLKRAMRTSAVFAETTQVEASSRTRWITRKLVEALKSGGKSEEEAAAVATSFAKAYAGKMDAKKTERTSVLLYIGAAEIVLVSERLLAGWETLLPEAGSDKTPFMEALVKDIIKATSNHTSAPDIALFGRMLADKPELSLEAACQVAHAISTHRVAMEMDFYTAVDDLTQTDEAGAGMMGFTGFNSACFYRYACLDWNQLLKNLDGDYDLARRTVRAFLLAALAAVPSGKQNSFAAQNPPSFALAVTRANGGGWSLANAFEKPVRPRRDSGLVGPSVQALDAYWGRMQAVYGNGKTNTAALALEADLELASLKDAVIPDINAWVEVVMASLPEARQ